MDYKKTIALAKTVSPDNDTRQRNEPWPCLVNDHDVTLDEIDNPGEDFNWQEFWRECKREYPLHSVAGGLTYSTPEIISRCEEQQVPHFAPKLKPEPNKKLKVLEIGYGYGGAAKRFHALGFDYYGIDYVSSGKPNKRYGKFIEISKSGIPKDILDKGEQFCLVYSENVFQHLTHKQRLEYYHQAHKILKPGGMLYLKMFTCNDSEYENHKYDDDNKGKPYCCHFFGVQTSVPKIKQVNRILKRIGFAPIDDVKHTQTSDPRTNYTTFKYVKK